MIDKTPDAQPLVADLPTPFSNDQKKIKKVHSKPKAKKAAKAVEIGVMDSGFGKADGFEEAVDKDWAMDSNLDPVRKSKGPVTHKSVLSDLK